MNIDTTIYRKHERPNFGNTLLGEVPLVSDVYLMDCVELMKHYPDKYFDLAVVDPPYGIKAVQRMYKGRGGYVNPKEKYSIKKANHTIKEWDNERPKPAYWEQLFRVSKNQIVWGGNYFTDYLPISRGWIFWDKDVHGDFSKGELAWTSFDFALNKVLYVWDGMRQGQHVNKTVCKGGNWKQGNPCGLEKRIHPTQKPVALYDWIFKNYSKKGMVVLDTHIGSGSSRISADKNGLHLVGCEIDEEYFNKSNKRYEEFISQSRLYF